jgi:hypothetical protein
MDKEKTFPLVLAFINLCQCLKDFSTVNANVLRVLHWEECINTCSMVLFLGQFSRKFT